MSFPIKRVIFHSYVKLPEGNYIGYPRIGYISYIVNPHLSQSHPAATSCKAPRHQRVDLGRWLTKGSKFKVAFLFVVTNDYMSYPLVMYVQ